MTRPDSLPASALSRDVNLLQALLRASLVQALNRALRQRPDLASARSLRAARAATRTNDLQSALRHTDRAWRCHPEDESTLGPIYGRLLTLEASDDYAALRVLQHALELNPDPDVASLMALGYLRLGRIHEARRHLELALADYCVLPGSLLPHVAILLHPGIAAPGWFGRGVNLELIGELRSDEASSVLDIRVDGAAAFSQLLLDAAHDGRRPFAIRPQQLGVAATLEASTRGVALLGSGARLPAHFAIDGRSDSRGRKVSGWARLGWSPTRPLRLRFEDEQQRHALLSPRGFVQVGWRWPFAIDLRTAGLRGKRIEIAARVPDGSWQPLPDSPLWLEPAARLTGRPAHPMRRWRAQTARRPKRAPLRRTRRTVVIMPVFRGAAATLACIDAVLASVDPQTGIVVVDDASDEPALISALDALATAGRITLLRNTVNLGFASSVNRALKSCPGEDAVLLNSDTLVFDDWLVRLRAAAYSARNVGTVTPLSNNGTIASYPRALGAALEAEDAPALHALAAATHSGRRFDIPVGVGFCLYVRRDCLDDVGMLDAVIFGKGYGEETDFCLRARLVASTRGRRLCLSRRRRVFRFPARSPHGSQPATAEPAPSGL